MGEAALPACQRSVSSLYSLQGGCTIATTCSVVLGLCCGMAACPIVEPASCWARHDLPGTGVLACAKERESKLPPLALSFMLRGLRLLRRTGCNCVPAYSMTFIDRAYWVHPP